MANAEAPLTDDRPLLSFGGPDEGDIPLVDGHAYLPPPHKPSAGQQGERLGPKFDQLKSAILNGRLQLTQDTPAQDPELVAVFDLAGPVDAFYKAAQKVPGLDFLFDSDEGTTEPDDDFFYEKDGEATDGSVPQHLYMVMTNETALSELIRLFQRWKEDEHVTLDRGLNPFKQVFSLLRNIRRWGPQDRVRETGILIDWKERVAIAASQSMRAEIELWYRSEPVHREAGRRAVEAALSDIGGIVVSSSTIESVRYHGLLVELPRAAVESVLANGVEAIDLLTVEDVMFVSPVSQHSAVLNPSTGDAPIVADAILPRGNPRVALLDGLPLGNHDALAGRLVIDDPDDIAAKYAANQRRHGTAMASLIIHGPLEAPGPPLTRPLYVRPILQPDTVFQENEVFSPDELFIDVLHRSLLRIFGAGTDIPPLASEVRIVNLSIGDSSRTFVRKMSPHARLLDWFSHQYNALIVVSSGNHSGTSTEPDVSRAALDDINVLQSEVLRSLQRTERHRRLFAPAEGVNVITVGSSHSDGGAALPLPDHLVDPLPEGMPATYSAVGFGYRRSVKPEILMPGGRQVLELPVGEMPSGPIHLVGASGVEVAGLTVATPGLLGELNGRALTCGTSNSAALATRALARIFDLLETPGGVEGELPGEEFHPVMAKALLIHAASWGNLKNKLVGDLGLEGNPDRHALTQFLGYGMVDGAQVGVASTRKVTLLGAGLIKNGKRHTYHYPLPGTMRATTEWRRLTVTLAWLSQTNSRTQKYRVARLRFNAPNSVLGVDPEQADRRASVRGTVQHEVFEGRRAVAFLDGDTLAIDVDCRIDVGSAAVATRYGIAASLEVGPAIRADIHNEVRQLLQARIRPEIRERVRS